MSQERLKVDSNGAKRYHRENAGFSLENFQSTLAKDILVDNGREHQSWWLRNLDIVPRTRLVSSHFHIFNCEVLLFRLLKRLPLAFSGDGFDEGVVDCASIAAVAAAAAPL